MSKFKQALAIIQSVIPHAAQWEDQQKVLIGGRVINRIRVGRLAKKIEVAKRHRTVAQELVESIPASHPQHTYWKSEIKGVDFAKVATMGSFDGYRGADSMLDQTLEDAEFIIAHAPKQEKET